MDALGDLLDSLVAGERAQQFKRKGERLGHAAGGDDVAVLRNLLAGIGALGEAFLKAREARGMVPLEQVELAQDKRGGADGGDVDSAGYGRTWIAFDY